MLMDFIFKVKNDLHVEERQIRVNEMISNYTLND